MNIKKENHFKNGYDHLLHILFFLKWNKNALQVKLPVKTTQSNTESEKSSSNLLSWSISTRWQIWKVKFACKKSTDSKRENVLLWKIKILSWSCFIREKRPFIQTLKFLCNFKKCHKNLWQFRAAPKWNFLIFQILQTEIALTQVPPRSPNLHIWKVWNLSFHWKKNYPSSYFCWVLTFLWN